MYGYLLGHQAGLKLEELVGKFSKVLKAIGMLLSQIKLISIASHFIGQPIVHIIHYIPYCFCSLPILVIVKKVW